MRKLFLFITALTLSVGLWAENPPAPPAGEITYNGLLFHLVTNESVELVRRKDVDPQYTGDIVVPEQFEFIDSQSRKYILRVIWIDADAFKGCSITSVTLPASINKIGDNAFANCEQLTSVTCLGTEPATLGQDVFTNSPNVSIYVPIWTTETYKEQWSVYEGRIKLTDLDQAKEDALYLIKIARQGIQNTEINKMIDDEVNIIRSATTTEQITDAKLKAKTIITIFQDGKAEATTELLGTMAEKCTDCTAVEVTDGTTTVTLYAPESVKYIKK